MSSQEESRMLTAASEEFIQSRSSISSTPDVTSLSPLSSPPEEENPAHVVINIDHPESLPSSSSSSSHVANFSPRLTAAILSLGAPANASEQQEEEERTKTAPFPTSPSSLSIGRRLSQIAGMLPDRRFSVVSVLSAASQGRKICRFCWDGSGELVSSGCLCHESFLHQECLVRWIEANKRKEKIVCEICLEKHDVTFTPELQQRLEQALKAAEAMGLEEGIRQHHVLRHPRLAKVVLVLSVSLIVMAVLLVVAYVVIFSMSLTSTTP